MEQSVLLFSSEKQSNPRYAVEKLWIPEISVQNREGTPLPKHRRSCARRRIVDFCYSATSVTSLSYVG